MPKKKPLVVDDPDEAFKKFEDLTRRLLLVPREELTEQIRMYSKKNAAKKRGTYSRKVRARS